VDFADLEAYTIFNLLESELMQKSAQGLAALNPVQAAELPSLAEIAYRQVRDAILSGAFSAGHPLGQEEIALQIGTSRVPLREALKRLEAEGLVIHRPRRGYVVTSLDPEEITDIFDIRMLLEERAGYLATLRATPEDVAELKERLYAMDGISTAEPDQILRFVEANRAFHDRLYLGSGRPQLCRLMAVLRTNVERYIRIGTLVAGDQTRVKDEHFQIFDAFRRGNAKEVGRLCREHCETTRDRLLARLAVEVESPTAERPSDPDMSGLGEGLVTLSPHAPKQTGSPPKETI
jgi:DNA-binding GntR family transcriptional regulator